MPLFDVIDLFDDETARNGPEQMALDEALLEIAPRPLLRIYRWAEPTVSFGYSLPLASGERPFPRSALRSPMDRAAESWDTSTIGRSLCSFPRASRWPACGPLQAYRLIHSRRGGGTNEDRLRGTSGRTVAIARKASPASRLPHYTMSSALIDRKLCGGAQRRTRRGFLHQGSIQNVSPLRNFSPTSS